MNFSSIRFRLIAGGILLVLIPLAISGYVSITNSIKVATQLSKANAQSIANGAATEILATYEGELKFASAFAGRTQVQMATEKINEHGIEGAGESIATMNNDLHKRLEKLHHYYAGIFLTDANGRIFAEATEDGASLQRLEMSQHPLFAAAKNSKQTVSGDIERSANNNGLVMLLCSPIHGENGTFLGVFGALLKVKALTDLISNKKIGTTGYCFMINTSGIIIAHPDEQNILRLDLKTLPGMEHIAATMRDGQNGAESYVYKGLDKVAGFAPIKQKGWSVAATQNADEFLASAVALRNAIVLISIISILAASGIIFWAASAIVRPIKQTVVGLKDIAQGEGDLTMRLCITSKDEVGELAHWFNIFIEKPQNIISQINQNTHSVNSSAGELTNIATDLSQNAQETSDRADNVATAVEEMSANLNNVAAAMEQSTTNITMVAGAAEEMTATISQIAQNAQEAHTISSKAVLQAADTSEKMTELGQAAEAIGKVTETITEISEQTNLLALNATIEAARAGEAGKGFAVVANEIKELAKQTASATMDIKNQIEGIQGTTRATVAEINQVSAIINEINKITTTISLSVGEQSTATQEIAGNIAQASMGLGEVNENVNQSSSVAGTITQDIAGVNMASREISQSSTSVQLSAGKLQQLADELLGVINTFRF
ncbi:MAG: methyl-accepting chemotaxis protein [Desulfobulbus sp.]